MSQNRTVSNISHISQVSQRDDKHQRPLGVCCNEITVLLLFFLPFLLKKWFLPCFYSVTVTFYRRDTLIQWLKPTSEKPYCTHIRFTCKDAHTMCLKTPGRGWQLGHWPRTLGLLGQENASYLLFRFYTGSLFLPVELSSCPGVRFSAWILALWF